MKRNSQISRIRVISGRMERDGLFIDTKKVRKEPGCDDSLFVLNC
jgi:hypothetical protein